MFEIATVVGIAVAAILGIERVSHALALLLRSFIEPVKAFHELRAAITNERQARGGQNERSSSPDA